MSQFLTSPPSEKRIEEIVAKLKRREKQIISINKGKLEIHWAGKKITIFLTEILD